MEWLVRKFELSRGGGAHNVRPMEGLRGFAVLLVFLVHYATLVRPWLGESPALRDFSAALHTLGNAGVDLFFVLSGYLIYGSLIARPQPFLAFMARRAERIYPAFLAVFAIYVGLSFVFPAENKIPATPLGTATYLVQNLLLLPGLFPIEPLITVAWSLSYEMFYYLALPPVIALFGLRERSSRARVLFFLVLAGAGLLGGALFGGPLRLVMFLSGILLHEAVRSGRLATPSGGWTVTVLALGLLAQLLPLNGAAGYVLKIGSLFVAFFVLCLPCVRTPAAWLPRAFSWTPLRWLGNMSYSYYLLHGLALKAGFLLLGLCLRPAAAAGPWVFWLLLPVMFALTLLPSTTLFVLIERPFSLTPQRPVGRPGLAGRSA